MSPMVIAVSRDDRENQNAESLDPTPIGNPDPGRPPSCTRLDPQKGRSNCP
jgi:hypothetical protein